MDNNAAGQYGEEVGRLQLAAGLAKRASEKANSVAGVAKPAKDEVTKLRNDITKDLATASKDNDLIYHKDVPAPEALPKIAGIDLVKAAPIPELTQPSFLVGPSRESPIFGDLLAHGARAAVGECTNYFCVFPALTQRTVRQSCIRTDCLITSKTISSTYKRALMPI